MNYCRVTGLLKNSKGKITGVKAIDEATGNELKFNSRLVINATGVFADEIARMDDPAAHPQSGQARECILFSTDLFCRVILQL